MAKTWTGTTRAFTVNPTRFIDGIPVSLALVLSILVTDADAYIDPGTGSYIFQLLIAGLFGAAYAVKLYWIKIRVFLRTLFSKSKQNSA